MTKCPSNDFRTPHNANVVNRMLRDIALNSSSSGGDGDKIGFIDARVVIDPVYDKCGDWSHYTGPEGTEEIKYILREILREEGYYE